MTAPRFKELRSSYGFDEVSIVTGDITINPDQTNIDFKLESFNFPIPFMAAAMDAVTDVNFTTLFNQLGGLAVLHLEGIQTRYNNPQEVLTEITQAPDSEVTALLQKVYSQPIKDNLVSERIAAIKKSGAACAVSVAPANTKRLAAIAAEAKADILVVQSTVTTARHVSKSYHGLTFPELCKSVPMPVIVGNCVSYSACLELMRTGVAGILIGVGPGAACTSRQVLGIGVPQVTATIEGAAAREQYLRESGRYVAVITDGGMRNSGDVCKAFASGCDAVMLGSVFAQAKEAPGKGYHWGMSHPHPSLPRGTRIKVGTSGTLEQILFGPTSVTDGSQNLVGALRTAMGVCGVNTIQEMHNVEMLVAPSITTEGKSWQLSAARRGS
ncbi:GuaB3 family IMP dehydrogenase-related protein [Chloroflexota bacterium]